MRALIARSEGNGSWHNSVQETKKQWLYRRRGETRRYERLITIEIVGIVRSPNAKTRKRRHAGVIYEEYGAGAAKIGRGTQQPQNNRSNAGDKCG